MLSSQTHHVLVSTCTTAHLTQTQWVLTTAFLNLEGISYTASLVGCLHVLTDAQVSQQVQQSTTVCTMTRQVGTWPSSALEGSLFLSQCKMRPACRHSWSLSSMLFPAAAASKASTSSTTACSTPVADQYPPCASKYTADCPLLSPYCCVPGHGLLDMA